MKKSIKYICFLILGLAFFNIDVYASTNTYTRTEDDLLVKDSINVTEYNKDIILATPAVDAEEKVYDFADLFTDSEEYELYNAAIEYINNYGMDLAIVTIDDNNKLNAQEYAQDFYDYNEFRTDGVLFLIDMDTREIYMTTTGSAIDMYNDYRIDQILDSTYYYVSSGDYYETADSFINEVSYYASIGLPNNSDVGNDKIAFADIFLQCFLIALVITVIIMVILVMKNRMVRKATSSREYLVKETMQVNHVSEVFLGAFVNKVRRSHDSGSSSGGGSSTSSGSSGVSHGGGGRSF